MNLYQRDTRPAPLNFPGFSTSETLARRNYGPKVLDIQVDNETGRHTHSRPAMAEPQYQPRFYPFSQQSPSRELRNSRMTQCSNVHNLSNQVRRANNGVPILSPVYGSSLLSGLPPERESISCRYFNLPTWLFVAWRVSCGFAAMHQSRHRPNEFIPPINFFPTHRGPRLFLNGTAPEYTYLPTMSDFRRLRFASSQRRRNILSVPCPSPLEPFISTSTTKILGRRRHFQTSKSDARISRRYSTSSTPMH
ncbi:hypothetical protein B0H16DRAFT_1522453 [Mycena metata]|uniref:Uncharacterized protein n=1 Tax=Mycena metata TaxID=1033252 RepID=A0AAD7JNI9_9AGAR|nr:hypothetical protein B0H16DRAFT_1522453 [Mycena metata]